MAAKKKVVTKKILKSALPPRAKGERRYWLLKQEPSSFSFDDLLAAPKKTTCWDRVRNYTARNYMRDEMAVGDLAFYYHSNAEPSAIVGVVEIVKKGYPDHTAFDSKHDHFDPDSDPNEPTWYMVDVRAVAPIVPPMSLDQLRKIRALDGMELLKKGSRLSVQVVSAAQFACIMDAASVALTV